MSYKENKKWFSGVILVFHDLIDSIGDSSIGFIHLIPIMIYGRSNRDQDFGKMYHVMLSNRLSAGIFRIYLNRMW